MKFMFGLQHPLKRKPYNKVRGKYVVKEVFLHPLFVRLSFIHVSFCVRLSWLLLSRYMCYNQTGDISTLEGTPLKLVDKFTYLGSSVESTEKDIETRLTKAWTAINRLSTIWKSDLTDKMKRSFFQAAVTSILLYGCTTWTLTKRLEKKLDGNYTRMLRAILNKSWQQHPTRHQLYGHLPPITKTIQVRRTRHAGHCWRSRDELIRDVLLWIPTHGRAKAGRPARTYIQQLCEDTGCCPEDLPRAMNDREEWRERVRDIRAASTIWWWWWYGKWVYNSSNQPKPSWEIAIDYNWCFWAEHWRKNGHHTCRDITKWFCNMTTQDYMLQNRWKSTWKHWNVKPYPNCHVHQTLPYPIITCWWWAMYHQWWYMAWLSCTFILMKMKKMG